MFDRSKLLFFGIVVVVSLWWFSSRNEAPTSFYSFEEFTDDMSRTYYDIAHAAYTRNDIDAAINACTIALQNRPNFTQANELLDLCYEQKQEIRSFLTTYHDLVNEYYETTSTKISILEQLEAVSDLLVNNVLTPILCNVCDAATTLMRNDFVHTIDKLHLHVNNMLEIPKSTALWQQTIPNKLSIVKEGDVMNHATLTQNATTPPHLGITPQEA